MLSVVSCTPTRTAVVSRIISTGEKKTATDGNHGIVRFWGWSENAAEVLKDKEEMSQRLKEGKPLYGESTMPEHVLQNAARNSRFAQLKFSKLH